MKRKLAIFFSVLFPGVGQIILGRYVNGFFLFAVYTFFLLLGISRFLVSDTFLGDRALCLAVGAAAAAWACALIETLQVGVGRKSKGTKADRDQHLRSGIVCYLKGEFGRAAEEFEAALALDRNDQDARFHLAMALKAQGSHRKARRALKQCLALDPNTKWYPEICDELENL